jgi:hypothetical protein
VRTSLRVSTPRRRWTRRAAIFAALGTSAVCAVPAQAEDEITPVVARTIAAPQQVLAADGRRHLAYELQLDNLSRSKATIQRIDVLARGRVVQSVDPAFLARMMRPFAGAGLGNALNGGQGGVVLMDVSFPAGRKLPRRLVHRLTIGMDPADPSNATRYLTARTRVVRRPAVIVAPPLRGSDWVVGNGCCDTFTAHRGAVLPVNGALHVAERFAIDFVQIDAAGRLFSGPQDAFSSYGFFGDDVLSATAGKVVGKLDDIPETTPGSFPESITAAQAGGNHVVVKMRKGRFAFYAHLQPGSITVDVGDRVRVGQKLGLLGNSGNSDAPHLHFHVMDSPAPLASNSIPFRFSSFTARGRIGDLDGFVAGEVAEVEPALAGAHARQLPLDLQVIDFP